MGLNSILAVISIIAIALCDCYRIQSVLFTERADWDLEWMTSFQRKMMLWCCWKFWWHSIEIWCHLNCLMQDWQHSAVVRSCKVSGLWKWAMLCTLALSAACSLYRSQEPLVFGVPRLWDVLSVGRTLLDFSIKRGEALQCLQCCMLQGWWWMASSWTYQ